MIASGVERRAFRRAAIAALLLPAVSVGAPASAGAAKRSHEHRSHRYAARRARRGASHDSRTGRKKIAMTSLFHPGSTSYFAFVERTVVARGKPWKTARAIYKLHERTFWRTSELVLALDVTKGSEAWTRVRLPAPGDPTGWVPTSALSEREPVHTWLKVDRRRLRATLIRNGRKVFEAPVGVGKPRWPTPDGQFYIEESLTPPERGGLYGPLAFGTSARSHVLTEWPNGGQIGVHGTNEPWLIPGRISHGCIRMSNANIQRLGRLMPVGTPITIR